MNKLLLATFLFFISILSFARTQEIVGGAVEIDFDKIQAEKKKINYGLNELIEIIDSCIQNDLSINAPKNATEFEKVLLTARRIQHNDSQIVAIKIFRYLLEFNCYRTTGEELYLKYLLATSLKYVGAPLIANSYYDQVFPTFLDYISDRGKKIDFLNTYGATLIGVKNLEESKATFQKALKLAIQTGDIEAIYKSRNNYSYVLHQLNEYDSAAHYYKIDQNLKYQQVNPVLFAFAFGNYGSLLFDLQQYDSSIFYLKKEVQLLKEVPSTEGIQNTYFNLGNCYLKLDNLDSAKHYYHMALILSKQEGYLPGTLLGYEKLLSLYSIEEKDPMLGKFLTNFFEYNDSLKKQLSFKSYEDEVQISRFMKIVNEAKLSKNEYDLLESNNRDLKYLAMFLIAAIIGLTTFLYIRRRGQLKLAAVNKVLVEKNEELSASNLVVSESNERNELLLKELHHRVKNNLQMIVSLFSLQRNTQDLTAKERELFKVAQDRIYSIALVHKKIYQSDKFSSLNFKDYLKAFIDEIVKAQNQKITVNYNIDGFELSIDSAVPIGLIVNELFANSIKHSGRENDLIITISQQKCEKSCEFIYQDNGGGLPDDVINDKYRKSIGLTLVELLADQLEATIEFSSHDEKQEGFYFSLKGNFR